LVLRAKRKGYSTKKLENHSLKYISLYLYAPDMRKYYFSKNSPGRE
jgi:hypothetical protein